MAAKKTATENKTKRRNAEKPSNKGERAASEAKGGTLRSNSSGKKVRVCSHCKNDYDKAFQVVMPTGESFFFDSFECAITALAKECAHCGCRILGHGLETDGHFYCCANCAARAGERGFVDRIR